MYNWRPVNLSPPPVEIYCPAFVKFTQAMAADVNIIDFDHVELTSALGIVRTSLEYHPTENNRIPELRPFFAKVGLTDLLRADRFCLDDGRAVQPDGLINHREDELYCRILVAFTEVRNEIGGSGYDPISRAECYYVSAYTSSLVRTSHGTLSFCALIHRNSSLQNATLRRVSCYPALLVGIAGPTITVSGAVYAHRLMSQRLTGPVSLVPLATRSGRSPFTEAVFRVAQLCRALRECVEDLKSYYDSLRIPSPDSAAPVVIRSQVPTPSPKILPFIETSAAEKFIGPHLTRLNTTDGRTLSLTYVEHLPHNSPSKALFRAILTTAGEQDRAVVVKFTYTYCAEAHRLLADMSLAPMLHYCGQEDSVGGLFVVVMDYVEPALGQESTPAHVEMLREAAKRLHDNGYVHGDIRGPNVILVDEKNLKVIDFDWSGREGSVRYPVDVNLSSDIEWHEDVRRLGRIMKEHDEHLVERFTKQERP